MPDPFDFLKEPVAEEHSPTPQDIADIIRQAWTTFGDTTLVISTRGLTEQDPLNHQSVAIAIAAFPLGLIDLVHALDGLTPGGEIFLTLGQDGKVKVGLRELG